MRPTEFRSTAIYTLRTNTAVTSCRFTCAARLRAQLRERNRRRSSMKMEGTQELRAKRERVYQALIDPAVLQRCIPGCERLEKTSENAYSITMRAGVGSIKGVFTGTVKIEDTQPPSHFRIIVEGKG